MYNSYKNYQIYIIVVRYKQIHNNGLQNILCSKFFIHSYSVIQLFISFTNYHDCIFICSSFKYPLTFLYHQINQLSSIIHLLQYTITHFSHHFIILLYTFYSHLLTISKYIIFQNIFQSYISYSLYFIINPYHLFLPIISNYHHFYIYTFSFIYYSFINLILLSINKTYYFNLIYLFIYQQIYQINIMQTICCLYKSKNISNQSQLVFTQTNHKNKTIIPIHQLYPKKICVHSRLPTNLCLSSEITRNSLSNNKSKQQLAIQLVSLEGNNNINNPKNYNLKMDWLEEKTQLFKIISKNELKSETPINGLKKFLFDQKNTNKKIINEEQYRRFQKKLLKVNSLNNNQKTKQNAK